MVELHKVILPFQKWAFVTGIAFVVCIGFAIMEHERNAPDEPTAIEEPSE